MLIITHDEHFVQKLGRSGAAEKYYYIEKRPVPNSDRGELGSTVTSRRIADLGASTDGNAVEHYDSS